MSGGITSESSALDDGDDGAVFLIDYGICKKNVEE